MRKALNTLGVGPTHHMHEIGSSAVHRQLWLDLVNGATPDWVELFNGYNACVDWPSAYYWRALIREYPDAKVLLTMRSAESWWKSFEATILRHILNTDDRHGFTHQLIAQQVFEGRPDDRDHAIRIYNRNVDEVIGSVAPDRLLVHNLGDGWLPLCRWLECPVPEIEYPYGNTTKDFIANLEC